MKQVKHETLKIRNKLPQIILPENKIGMFIDWYNEDLRFQDTIPRAFNEGYIFLKNDIVDIDVNNYRNYIKQVAHELNGSFREIENRLTRYINSLKDIIIYFLYQDDYVNIKTYVNDEEKPILSKISFKVGQTPEEEFVSISRYVTEMKDWDDLLYKFNYHIIVLFSTCMWYLATSTKTTKYYYEKYTPQEYKESKNIKKVHRHKTISTPIYDMNKIRRVKIAGLVKQRKGWTYSHSFQVHGHYRHYKNSKTVFINSYIKGKDKELQSQIITINPKN